MKRYFKRWIGRVVCCGGVQLVKGRQVMPPIRQPSDAKED
jgi:hypothetical protein